MCNTPENLDQAIASYKVLDDNMRSRKKAFETAEARLKAAKKLIADANADKPNEEGYEIAADDCIIAISKARATDIITDPVLVHQTLEAEESGLGDQLMTFSITELKKHLSPRQLAALTSKSYGARTFKVNPL